MAVVLQIIEPFAMQSHVEMPQEIPFEVAATSANVSAGSGGAAALTIPADSDRPNVLGGIWAGYDDTPQAGANLKVEDGSGNTVWGPVPITVKGMNYFQFYPARCNRVKNTALIITLSAGGGSVSAYVSANAWKRR